MDSKTDLRARLVQEAMRLLAQDTAEITLRGVARAAGVSAMAPYRHFADKAALMRAVTESGFEMLRGALLEADRNEDDRAALLAQGMAYIGFAVAHPTLFRMMFAHPKIDSPGKDRIGETAYGVLAHRIAQMVPDQTEAAITAAWAIVHGLATLTLDVRLPPASEHTRAALRLFVAGLPSLG